MKLKCAIVCVFYMTFYNLQNFAKLLPKMQKRTFQGDHATDLGLWALRLSPPLVFSPRRGPWYKCLCLCTELVKLMVLFCFIITVFFKWSPFGHWPRSTTRLTTQVKINSQQPHFVTIDFGDKQTLQS